MRGQARAPAQGQFLHDDARFDSDVTQHRGAAARATQHRRQEGPATQATTGQAHGRPAGVVLGTTG